MRLLVCCLAPLLLAAAADAAPNPGILLTDGDRRIILAPADLAALPSVTVTTTAYTHHGPVHGAYTGPLLWTLLTHERLVDPSNPRDQAKHTLLITGSDGYAAALAVGEISPAFENKAVIVAEQANGAPLGDAHLRIVVPGDGAASRYVHDIVSIELR